MDKIPFSVYDFFAYLSSGTILLATADYVMGLGLLQQDKVGPVTEVEEGGRTTRDNGAPRLCCNGAD